MIKPCETKSEFIHVLFPVVVFLLRPGLCSSSEEWGGAEETWEAFKHHLSRQTLLRRAQPDLCHLGTRNRKGRNVTMPLFIVLLLHD